MKKKSEREMGGKAVELKRDRDIKRESRREKGIKKARERESKRLHKVE